MLPVTDALPDLTSVLRDGSNAVLVAPPGAGKTTLVPLALLEEPWLAGQGIVMIEPRRLAARAAATRMSELIGEPVGGLVGYRTRLESRVGPATRIEVVTEGLLVRRLLGDPGLHGVGCVILDEVHERNLDGDMAAAFCLDLQRSFRPELRLLLMSATADGARLAGLFAAPVVESLGRMFPVEIRHGKRDVTEARDLPEAAAAAVRGVLAEAAGDVLVFLPGMGEIRRTERLLAGCGARVLPLHGELPQAEQDLALRPQEERRVVLATSIAETSLTVPGVRIVVDGGWRRTPRLDAASGLTRLATVRISRAAAEQRAGRAGREGPGLAVRLWTPALHRGLPAFDRPEMLEAELAGLALGCLAWGTPAGELPFQDPPPTGALAAAAALLGELGATGPGGLTEHGRRMVALGAHPRLAAMMLAAESPAEAALAADLAALLEERDPLRLEGADLALRLAAIAEGPTQAAHPQADRAALSRIRNAARGYRRRLHTEAAPAGDPARLVAAGFPDRIAQRRGEPGSFRLSGGGSARLPVSDPLARAGLLSVASLEQKLSARIRLAAPLDPTRLPPSLAARVTVSVESNLDPVSGSVLSRRRTRLGALVLEDRMVPASPEETAAALAGLVARDLALLPWDEESRTLQARAALLATFDTSVADLSDAALATDAVTWLAPLLHGMTKLGDLQRLDLLAALRQRLGWQTARRLDDELPRHLALPGGRAIVDYLAPVPTASARAQAFYGVVQTPRLAGGRVALNLALLSPAGRPIAVTADLAGFWGGAWLEVRKEMRGRYPRHDWPERPGG